MIRYLLPLLLLAGCGATTGEPRIVTRDVLVPIATPCPDRRGPAPDYPDTDEVLHRQPGESNDAHLARVVPKLLAGRELHKGRDAENEAQIAACARAAP